MKRFFAIALVLLFACGLCFATSDGKQGTLPSPSSANLELNLNSDKYLIGFSKTDEYTSMGGTAFGLSETVKADFTVKLEKEDRNAFYMFYKVLTDSTTVKIKLSIDSPLYYYNSTTSSLTDGTNDYETIQYRAYLTTERLDWKGEFINGTELDSNTNRFVEKLIRDSSTKSYLTYGICKIFIFSNEELSGKVPGLYKSTMTISLISE